MTLTFVGFPAGSRAFGVIGFALLSLSYVVGGLTLGLRVSRTRHLPKAFVAAGQTAVEAVLWPQTRVGATAALVLAGVFLVIFALVHLGTLIGDAIATRRSVEQSALADWQDYLNAILLVVGAEILKIFVEGVLR